MSVINEQIITHTFEYNSAILAKEQKAMALIILEAFLYQVAGILDESFESCQTIPLFLKIHVKERVYHLSI